MEVSEYVAALGAEREREEVALIYAGRHSIHAFLTREKENAYAQLMQKYRGGELANTHLLLTGVAELNAYDCALETLAQKVNGHETDEQQRRK